MHLPTLYTINSNKNKITWDIWNEKNKIIRQYGVHKKQIVEKTVHGKNKGKSNETDDEKQAEKEMLVLWKKQIDKGYKPVQTENTLYQNYLKEKEKNGGGNYTTETKKEHCFQKSYIFHPMLAKTWDKKKIYKNTYVQPKLDGVRCIAYKYNGNVILMSRNNKQFPFFHHIRKQLEHLKENIVLDGEIYMNHSPDDIQNPIDFNTITSACNVRRIEPHPIEKELAYCVFDIYDHDHPTMTFEKRLALHDMHDIHDKQTHIHKVETIKINSIDRIEYYYNKFMQQKYEGIMIRDGEGVYEQKKRSKYLQKHKQFMDSEYKIIGAKQGKGTEKGCIVWRCITPQQTEFEVRPNGDFETRRKMFENKDRYIGQYLTVRYQNLSKDDVPRFPVGICIRNYE